MGLLGLATIGFVLVMAVIVTVLGAYPGMTTSATSGTSRGAT